MSWNVPFVTVRSYGAEDQEAVVPAQESVEDVRPPWQAQGPWAAPKAEDVRRLGRESLGSAWSLLAYFVTTMFQEARGW